MVLERAWYAIEKVMREIKVDETKRRLEEAIVDKVWYRFLWNLAKKVLDTSKVSKPTR